MMYLTVDGMLSGTGIRNSIEGGYLDLSKLKLSSELIERISIWLSRYEEAHYFQYQDELEVDALDSEGKEICIALREELPNAKIDYFSNAKMKKLTT